MDFSSILINAENYAECVGIKVSDSNRIEDILKNRRALQVKLQHAWASSGLDRTGVVDSKVDSAVPIPGIDVTLQNHRSN